MLLHRLRALGIEHTQTGVLSILTSTNLLRMLLGLPDELLLLILRLVDEGEKSDDISACRFVCKKLARIAEPIVFWRIVTYPSEGACSRLLRMSESPLRRHVTNRFWLFEGFDANLAASPALFKSWLLLQDSGIPHEADTKSWLKDTWARYRAGHQWEVDLEQSLQDTVILAAALGRFERLRCVQIAKIWDSDAYDEDSRPPRRHARSPVGHRIFTALVTALAASTITLEELVLGFYPYGLVNDHGPVGIIQGLSPAYAKLYRRAFRGLKSLQITLPWSWDDRAEAINYAGLATLIGSANELEELHMEADENIELSRPEFFFQSIHVPKLKVLALANIQYNKAKHLVDFVENHSATLRTLELHAVALNEGSWIPTLDSMRDLLTLDSCSVCELVDDSDSIQGVPDWAVQNFLLRTGKVDKASELPHTLLDSTALTTLLQSFVSIPSG
ncbi:hypothetical protein PG985_008739 [Apiospora marii]|uniref:uncharacterized protein n=1 Tax=Apiospora marii TaxID=335849 RepID=UPI0031326403